jgi:hypothetical protein
MNRLKYLTFFYEIQFYDAIQNHHEYREFTVFYEKLYILIHLAELSISFCKVIIIVVGNDISNCPSENIISLLKSIILKLYLYYLRNRVVYSIRKSYKEYIQTHVEM